MPSSNQAQTKAEIQVPFEGVAVRKLHDLFERGYTVCGVAIQRPSLVADADRGAITTHGMVMWWPPEQHKIEQVPAPKNLYEITGNVADMNTVLIERAELRRLQAENDGVHALIAVHQRTLERCLDLKAECAELEAMLDAVGAGGVGQSIKPPVLPDTAQIPDVRIRTSAPDGWKLVPAEPTDEMFIEGMEADCRGRPSIDDDKHVRSIWRAMLSSAPDAPQPPAAQQNPVGYMRWKNGSAEYVSVKRWEVPFDGDWHTIYTTPQPTENLNCKSNQKRLATLWGYVKQEPDHFRDATQMVPARPPLTEDQIAAAVDQCETDLKTEFLIEFARAIEEAVWKKNS